MVPFHLPYYGRRTIDNVTDAIASNSLHGGSQTAEKLQQRLVKLLEVKDLLLTPSCTTALEIAVRLAGFGPGDEVIVPSFTFVSSASAITSVGALPVFVDISKENLSLDINLIQSAITTRTAGILTVHYAGQAADMAKLKKLADKAGLILIEDAAHAIFCKQNDQYLGSFGNFATFSFHDTKVISSGEGGALVVNDDRYRQLAYIVREKGTNRRDFLEGKVDKYGWIEQGTSAFLSGLPAALLGSQLDEWDEILEKRKSIYDIYARIIGPVAKDTGVDYFKPLSTEIVNYHIFWLNFLSMEKRKKVQTYLTNQKINSSSHYPALHLSEYCKKMRWGPKNKLPVTERTADCILRLPIYPQLTEKTATFIASKVVDALIGSTD